MAVVFYSPLYHKITFASLHQEMFPTYNSLLSVFKSWLTQSCKILKNKGFVNVNNRGFNYSKIN